MRHRVADRPHQLLGRLAEVRTAGWHVVGHQGGRRGGAGEHVLAPEGQRERNQLAVRPAVRPDLTVGVALDRIGRPHRASTNEREDTYRDPAKFKAAQDTERALQAKLAAADQRWENWN